MFELRCEQSGDIVAREHLLVVTASRDAATVRACVHLGADDYLVKPFAPERLVQALTLFRNRMGALADTAGLVQATGRPAPLRDLTALVAAEGAGTRRPLAA